MQSLRRTPYEDGYPGAARTRSRSSAGRAEESTALVAVSDELAEALAARYQLPRARRSSTPTMRSRATSRARAGAGRTAPERTAAARLPGDAVDERRPLRPARACSRRSRRRGSRSTSTPRARCPSTARSVGIRVHETLPARELLSRLAGYDFGWAGFNSTLNGAAPRHRAAEQALRVPRAAGCPC